MLPRNLKIEGLGPHTDTNIDFTQLDSPTAICAQFGTGKTTLLEALLFCLYGRGGWYADSIYDMLTQNGTGDGLIELDFTHAGKTYKAAREIRMTAATRRQTATLWLIGDLCDPVPVAGPKVTDFEAYIATLIGDYDTFIATCFLSQNRRGDLIGQPGEPDLVARRRSVFNDLIGSSALDAFESRAAEEMRNDWVVSEELAAQLAGESDSSGDMKAAQSRLSDAEAGLSTAKDQLRQEQEALNKAREALTEASGDDAQLKAQIERHDAARAHQDRISKHVESLAAEIEKLSIRTMDTMIVEGQVKELNRLLARRDDLGVKQAKHDAWAAWDRRRAEVSAHVTLMRSQVDSLSSIPGCDEATAALAATLDACLERGRLAKAENEAIASRNNVRQSARNELAGKKAELEIRRTALISKRDKTPETPFGEKCAPCQFLREWARIPQDIECVDKELLDCQSAIAAIPVDEPLTDLAELRAQYEQAKAANDSVIGSAKAKVDLVAAEAELVIALQKLESVNKSEPEKANDPSVELRGCQSQIDQIAGAPDRLTACRQAEADRKAKSEQRDALSQELYAAIDQSKALEASAESARKALSDRESQREHLRNDIIAKTRYITHIEIAIAAITEEIGSVKTKIQHIEERQAANDEKRERLAALQADIEALKDLRACFGSRGVRQILIDNAAPELEAIASDLFERATGGRMRLRIATQKPNQDGSIAEDFKILVTDERGERDALRYSGGQLQLIIILFRLAVAMWVGRLRGQRPDCMILDEAFDRLGSDGTEALLSVLDHLSDEIQLIVVVTHDRMIAERMRSHVSLERQMSGVKVMVA